MAFYGVRLLACLLACPLVRAVGSTTKHDEVPAPVNGRIVLDVGTDRAKGRSRYQRHRRRENQRRRWGQALLGRGIALVRTDTALGPVGSIETD